MRVFGGGEHLFKELRHPSIKSGLVAPLSWHTATAVFRQPLKASLSAKQYERLTGEKTAKIFCSKKISFFKNYSMRKKKSSQSMRAKVGQLGGQMNEAVK